jgi:CBS domain-containing protein
MSNLVHSVPLTAVTVADVMSPGLLTCAPGTPLRAVAAMMVVHEVHAVLLADGAGGAPAVVTDLDVVAAAAAIDAPAGGAASTPATIAPGSALLDAADVLAREDRSHLVVLHPDGTRPIGVLSTLDVCAALAGRDARAARMVRPRPARPAISTSRLDRVTVAQAMHPGVFACPDDASIASVAATLADRHVHCIAVHGADASAPWSIATDRDVVRAAVAGGDMRAADLGDASTVWTTPDATLEAAASLMVRERVSHLLVTGDREPVGVLSTLDVLDVLGIPA